MDVTTTRRPRGSGSLFKMKRGNIYWLKYYKNGVPVRESSRDLSKGRKGTSRREAEKLLAQRLGEHGGDLSDRTLKKLTVGDLFDDLALEYRNNDRRSAGHLELRWRLHLRPLFGDLRAVDVTSGAIARYVDSRKRESAANASVNRELAIVKRAFSLARQCGKIRAVPHIAMLQERNVRTGFLSSQDRDRLAAACAQVGLWMRTIFELGVTLGWRQQEILQLRTKQVNLVSCTVRLEPNSTKNSEGREVPMTDTIHTLLQACVVGKNPDDRVFTRADGFPVLDIRIAWGNCCVEARVGKFFCPHCPSQPVDEARRCTACSRTWRRNEVRYHGLIFHDLRRTAARNLRNQGIGEGVIMKIGGWKTRTVFERYAIVSQGDMAHAMRQLEAARRSESEAAKQEIGAFGQTLGQHGPEGDDSHIALQPAAPLRH